MADHKNGTSHTSKLGAADTPEGSAAAEKEFVKALRRGHTGDLNKKPERDTGASTTPA